MSLLSNYGIKPSAAPTAPPIVTNGLIIHLDASNPLSYSGSGTTWFDISGQGANMIPGSFPTYVFNGDKSYFNFNGTGHLLYTNSSQEYRDMFIVQRLSSSQPGLPMIVGRYSNRDASIRFLDGMLRSGPDQNDWQIGQTSKVFVNGQFNQTGVILNDFDAFIRVYRSTNSGNFTTSFPISLSSNFMSRHYAGRIYMVLGYNRELTNAEVEQNWLALKERFGL